MIATALVAFGTTVNAAAANAAGTSTEYTENSVSQQNVSDRIKLGLSSVLLPGMGTVTQKDVRYSYDADKDVVRMQFAGDSVPYSTVFINKDLRTALHTAYDQYLKDFDAHTLAQKNAYKAYGTTESRYVWEQGADRNAANTETAVGYRFVNGTPYFSLTLFENENIGDDTQSGMRTILLTKKQAADLIGYTDEKQLNEYAKLNSEMSAADIY